MMPNASSVASVAATQPEPLLRWIFQRDRSALTCELDVRSNHSFEVCVVPHSEPGAALVEHFDGPRAAFLRHAEIARRLRESGWVLVDHNPDIEPAAA